MSLSGNVDLLAARAAQEFKAVRTELGGKAALVHTHDDRYFTETETNTLLAGKAASSHTHPWSQITSTPATYPPATHGHALTDSNITGILPNAQLPSRLQEIAQDVSGTDLNSVIQTGFYRAYNSPNAPVASGWFWVKVIAHDTGTWIWQEAVGYTGGGDGNEYRRWKRNGTWGAWERVYGDATGLYSLLDGRYYTEAEINSQMAGKAAASHTHDDRYYTEAEIDTTLSQYQVTRIDTGWVTITYASGWTTQGDIPIQTRLKDGIVYARGLACKTSGSIAPGNNTIGTMGAVFRPTGGWLYLPGISSSSANGMTIQARDTGEIVCNPATTSAYAGVNGLSWPSG